MQCCCLRHLPSATVTHSASLKGTTVMMDTSSMEMGGTLQGSAVLHESCFHATACGGGQLQGRSSLRCTCFWPNLATCLIGADGAEDGADRFTYCGGLQPGPSCRTCVGVTRTVFAPSPTSRQRMRASATPALAFGTARCCKGWESHQCTKGHDAAPAHSIILPGQSERKQKRQTLQTFKHLHWLEMYKNVHRRMYGGL